MPFPRDPRCPLSPDLARAEAWAQLCELLHVVARPDYPPTAEEAVVVLVVSE